MVTLNLYFKLSYRIFRPRAGKTSLRGRDDEATLDGPSPLLEEPLSAPSNTTLADFLEARDSQISFSVTYGWSAFGGADHGCQNVGLAG